MKFSDALLLIDEPADDKDYGDKMAWSKETGDVIVKSKFGLCKCTSDWPIPFTPSEKDLSAIDYKIILSISEIYN